TLPPDRSALRVTLDTQEDWKVVEQVVGHFGDRVVPAGTVAAWLLDNPGVRALNSDIRQRGLADG
ncbi:MAG TPA: acylneuraminate cytidylyltransferase, partial [Catenuloplanes sp.]